MLFHQHQRADYIGVSVETGYTYIFRRFRGFERISARGRSAALAGLFVFGGWFHRHQGSFRKKVPITLLVVNLINAIHLSIFGSLFDLDVHD
ncbi:hypothetical protein [Paenibacillus validus]|uniref:hypothetical protein n=1 Tax=Paenibacillus validus TaxID=44253 RepID=UPI0015800AB0|nr:hypothetical protein [Paenibacillus validus]